jgi:hypothetical protein
MSWAAALHSEWAEEFRSLDLSGLNGFDRFTLFPAVEKSNLKTLRQ